MKKIIVAITILLSSSVGAETTFHLNGLFETFGSAAIREMPNSPGVMSIFDNGTNVTRKVATCFSLSFCGPEITKDQSIINIDNGVALLMESNTGKNSSETIILANNERVILASTIMFTDSITIENWEIQNSGNIAENYVLSNLYLVSLGIIAEAIGSTGNISISPDGKSISRNFMVCFHGCDLPTNRSFDITVVPEKKVFFTDKSSGEVIENLIINADYNAIVLYEKGGNMISVWTPI